MVEARGINRAAKGRMRVIAQSWTNSGGGLSLLIGGPAANLQCYATAQGGFTPCDFTPLTFGNVQDASKRCRMQSPPFRAENVDTITAESSLPYPIGTAGR
jgi:hypothetical protein